MLRKALLQQGRAGAALLPRRPSSPQLSKRAAAAPMGNSEREGVMGDWDGPGLVLCPSTGSCSQASKAQTKVISKNRWLSLGSI